jgi:hypothetical protein
MKVNEGRTDRLVRIILGVALTGLGMLVFRGAVGIALEVLGVATWLSGMTGFSLLYRLFGDFSTAEPHR